MLKIDKIKIEKKIIYGKYIELPKFIFMIHIIKFFLIDFFFIKICIIIKLIFL